MYALNVYKQPKYDETGYALFRSMICSMVHRSRVRNYNASLKLRKT